MWVLWVVVAAAPFPSTSFLMTNPRLVRERLMLPASFSLSPSPSATFCRSLPTSQHSNKTEQTTTVQCMHYVKTQMRLSKGAVVISTSMRPGLPDQDKRPECFLLSMLSWRRHARTHTTAGKAHTGWCKAVLFIHCIQPAFQGALDGSISPAEEGISPGVARSVMSSSRP